MGLKFIANSPYRDVEPDPDVVREVARSLIENGIVFCTDNSFIAGMMTSIFFAPHVQIAAELAWWSEDGSGDALKEAFESEAKERGAAIVQMSVLSNDKAQSVSKRLTENGYTPIEVGFVKVI